MFGTAPLQQTVLQVLQGVARMRELWAPPRFSDPDFAWQVRLTYLILRYALVISVVTALVINVANPGRAGQNWLGWLVSVGCFGLLWLTRRGYVDLVNWTAPLFIAVTTLTATYLGLLDADIAFAASLFVVAVATLLLGLAGGIVYGTCIGLVTLYYANMGAVNGLLPDHANMTILEHTFVLWCLIAATIALVKLVDDEMLSQHRRAQQHALHLERTNLDLAEAMASFRKQSVSLQAANAKLHHEVEQRRRMQAMLHTLVEATASATGDTYLETLVQHLGESVHAACTLIGEVVDQSDGVMHACAFWKHGALAEPFTYHLTGTPCEEVVRAGRTIYYQEGVREAFPDDHGLQRLGCVGYYGEPLTDSNGVVIGNLAVMHTGSLLLDEEQRSMLSIFAARSAAELERKRMERTLAAEREMLAQRVAERTADLQAANAQLMSVAQRKDDYLASISHEFRTPLNAIMGLAEVMEAGVYGALNKRQHHSMEVIRDSGSHLLELINDLLDVAKIEAGQMTLTKDLADLNSICNSSLMFVRTTAARKRVGITFTPDSQVHVVRVDVRRLKQVLVNLLSNAVKYTEQNGQVGLEVSCDEITDQIYLTVWDTGIGISAEHLATLFTPFMQVDSHLNRTYVGTGLGLVIVKRIVELHEGTIEVESQEGAGSRFTVALPWCRAELAALAPDPLK